MVARSVNANTVVDEDKVSNTIADPDLVNSGVKEEASACESAMFSKRGCSYEVAASDDVVLNFLPDELTAYRSYFLVGTYSKTLNEIVHVELVPADRIMLFLDSLSHIRVNDYIKALKPTDPLKFPKEYRYVVCGLLDKSTLKYTEIELALEKTFYDRLPVAVQSFIENSERINLEGQSMPF